MDSFLPEDTASLLKDSQILIELSSLEENLISEQIFWTPNGDTDKSVQITTEAQLTVLISLLKAKEFGHLKKKGEKLFSHTIKAHASLGNSFVVETWDGEELFLHRIYRDNGSGYPIIPDRAEKQLLDQEIFNHQQVASIMIAWAKKQLPEGYARTKNHFYEKGNKFYCYGT